LLHKANCIGVYAAFQFRASGIAFKDIGGEVFSQCLGDLTSTRVMDADKGYLWFTHAKTVLIKFI
jgi:hypothetical protein